jgi:hypothetical protein
MCALLNFFRQRMVSLGSSHVLMSQQIHVFGNLKGIILNLLFIQRNQLWFDKLQDVKLDMFAVAN